MRRSYLTVLACVSVLAASLVLPHAASALDACTAADIISQDLANCPNNTAPCSITKTFTVGNGCVLDFGARAVTLNAAPNGALDINSGSVTLKAGSLTIAANAISPQINGRGDQIAPAGSTGGRITIQTSGAVTIQKSGNVRGRIDVSGNAQAGAIDISAGGTVTIAGRLNADNLTTLGSGGSITIDAGADIVSQESSVITATGGIDSIGGGDMVFSARGKIDLGDEIDVRGIDGGAVSLTAGGQVVVRRIRANGTGDAGAGGDVTITAGTGAQILDAILVRGAAGSVDFGGGFGGSVSIDTQYGDLLIAKDIDASGATPDGEGGDIDLFAHGALTIQSGATVSVRSDGLEGSGGLIGLVADLSLSSAGTLDASGGGGGGDIGLDSRGSMTLTGVVDASGRTFGGTGGSVTIAACTGGVGTLSVGNIIDASGGGCSQTAGCGVGGLTDLNGCAVTVTANGNIKAGGPTGGENAITAREQLIINGKLNAVKTTGTGIDGQNVLQYPSRKTPVIASNAVLPAPTQVARSTCTLPNQPPLCLVPCPVCGNGIVEFPETCDASSGATVSCDGCSPFCQVENCNDSRVCTIDSCNPQLGCRNVPASTPCTEPPTPTPTVTPTPTQTRTVTPTPTPSNTRTETPTRTFTPTPTPTFTPTDTRTPTSTRTPPPTFTASATRTPTRTPSETPTATATATRTPTRTPTSTATPSTTRTSTPAPTESASPTQTPVASPPSGTPATITPTATAPPTATVIRTATLPPTTSPTPTPSNTPSAMATRTATRTPTPIPTPTPTPTATPTEVNGVPGDGNCDGGVTAADVTALVVRMGQSPDGSCPVADFNQDGVIDTLDLDATILFEFLVFEVSP